MTHQCLRIIFVLIFLFLALPPVIAQRQQPKPSPEGTPSATSVGTPPGGAEIDPTKVSPNERYEYDKLRLERDLQKEFLEWAQTRFWLLTALIVVGGFFGIRALVREMIAAELKDATRAAAKAEAAAEQTTKATSQVRADADKYRETVAQLSETATQVDKRFKDLEGRISAEGAHAVASSELQLSQLAGRVEELSEVVKTLASESRDKQRVVANYDERIRQLDQAAATKKASFSENSKYLIVLVPHPKNKESRDFGGELSKILTAQGYRVSQSPWGPGKPAQFGQIRILSKDNNEELTNSLMTITSDLVNSRGLSIPIQTEVGLHESFKSDAAIILDAPG